MKKKKQFDRHEFVRPTSLKTLFFAIILMVLTATTLKTSYPNMSDVFLLANTILNTLIIICCYIFACILAAIIVKLGGRRKR